MKGDLGQNIHSEITQRVYNGARKLRRGEREIRHLAENVMKAGEEIAKSSSPFRVRDISQKLGADMSTARDISLLLAASDIAFFELALSPKGFGVSAKIFFMFRSLRWFECYFLDSSDWD